MMLLRSKKQIVSLMRKENWFWKKTSRNVAGTNRLNRKRIFLLKVNLSDLQNVQKHDLVTIS